jgi:predicted metal-dependent HD superfamily phosphohydrolase
MNYQQLLQEVEKYIQTFYTEHPDERIIYHNKQHTQSVVSAAIQIANHYQLDDKDFFIVVTAAYFHDLGYYTGAASEHEQRGADMAAAFLNSLQVPAEVIEQVKGCILATQLPQEPHTQLEKIMSDADLFHLGSPEFGERDKLMRKEIEAIKGITIDKNEWRKSTIHFLENHHFQTDYCQLLLAPVKEENLQKLKKKQAEKTAAAAEHHTEKEKKEAAPAEDNSKSGKKKEQHNRPDRGIETMFRISSNNHQRLSDMADNKAHIMITVNSIILSVLLSVLLRKLDEYPHLVLPAMLLLVVCVATMVLSILATRPKIPEGTFSRQDIEDKKVNLLFFGNFYRMDLSDYAWGMEQVMNDRDFLYGSLIRDLHAQGVVLGKKYKLLRVAYNIFMFGLIIAVLAFALATLLYSQATTQ